MSGALALLGEAPPEYGVRLAAAPGISRVVAPNPGPMTLHGTNTYLLEAADGLIAVDPGPDDARHVEALLRAAAGRITRILLTHTHADHLGALPALQRATGAPSAGFHAPQDPQFQPDLPLRDGDTVDGLVALHTPGHASDHLCFARGDGVLLSGDHVMAWSTSVISPPGGNMADYVLALRRLLARDDRLFLPGHGPALPEPRPFLRALLQHRAMRESAILGRLSDRPVAVAELATALYPGLEARLRAAAERNVLAHLLKLQGEGLAAERDGGWSVTTVV